VPSQKRGDFFFLAHGIWVVSQRAVDVIKPIAGDDVEFLPVTVVGELDPQTERVKKIAKFDGPDLYIARPLQLVELAKGADGMLIGCVDEDEEPMLEVIQYAFDLEAINGLHLFRVRQNDVLLVSRKVRDAIAKAKLAGVKLVEVDYVLADADAGAAKTKRKTKTTVDLAAPKQFDFDKLGDTPRI
jgi:hypothetical protein